MEPPVVIMSWVSKLSFTTMGVQNNSGSGSLNARARSTSSAFAKAAGLVTMIALIPLD